MAVVRTTETKHQWRCHYFWGCGKWSDPRMTTLWLPGALSQPPFRIFILRKPFVGTCAQVRKGSEGQWTMSPATTPLPLHPHPRPCLTCELWNGTSFERFILICSWLGVGLWWLFPRDFHREQQGAQSPAYAHREGRDGCISCMPFSVQ